MGVEIGEYDIAVELVIEHLREVEHMVCAAFVAMDRNDGSTLRFLIFQEIAVVTLSGRHSDKCVCKDSIGGILLHPTHKIGILLLEIGFYTLHIFPVLSG